MIRVPTHEIARFLMVRHGAEFIEAGAETSSTLSVFNLLLGGRTRRGYCDMSENPHFVLGFAFQTPTDKQIDQMLLIGPAPNFRGTYGADEYGCWWFCYEQTIVEPIDEFALDALLARAASEVKYMEDLFDAIGSMDEPQLSWDKRLFIEPVQGVA